MWNYRILEHTVENDETRYYSLVECYYDEHGKPNGHTGPISFGYFEMPHDIRDSLTMAVRDAMKKPVLKEEEVYRNHPWEKKHEEQELRDAQWDFEDEEINAWDAQWYFEDEEINAWEPPKISVAEALARLTKERKEAEVRLPWPGSSSSSSPL